MASKEANKLKYQYNKKYVEAYWERRAQRENGQSETVKRPEKSVTLSTNDKDFFPELAKMDVETSVKREGRSDAKYIKALEDANRMYRSENKRLIRLLTKYQEVIKLGLTALKQKEDEEIEDFQMGVVTRPLYMVQFLFHRPHRRGRPEEPSDPHSVFLYESGGVGKHRCHGVLFCKVA